MLVDTLKSLSYSSNHHLTFLAVWWFRLFCHWHLSNSFLQGLAGCLFSCAYLSQVNDANKTWSIRPDHLLPLPHHPVRMLTCPLLALSVADGGSHSGHKLLSEIGLIFSLYLHHWALGCNDPVAGYSRVVLPFILFVGTNLSFWRCSNHLSIIIWP